MYTFSIAVHIVNVYKFSGPHFSFLKCSKSHDKWNNRLKIDKKMKT